MLNIINDGYTEAGYIRGEEGLHGPLSFRYRPMLAEQRDAVDEELIRKKAREGNQLLAAALHKHLVDWDLTDAGGQAAPISLENIRRLRPALFDKLYHIVSGRKSSDADPQATARDESDYVSRLLETAGAGQSPGEVREQADAKNSRAG